MQQNWEEALQLAKKGNPVQFPEITLLAKDGSQRIAQRTMSIVGNDVILVWNDLTAIRETEQALQDSEQRFRIMVEHTVVGVYVLRDNRYIYVNPSYANMLGWSAAALIGHDILEFADATIDILALIHQEQDQATEYLGMPPIVALPSKRSDPGICPTCTLHHLGRWHACHDCHGTRYYRTKAGTGSDYPTARAAGSHHVWHLAGSIYYGGITRSLYCAA